MQRERDATRRAVARHLVVIGEVISTAGGEHFKTVWDAVQAAFHTAPDAFEAAPEAQDASQAERWPDEIGPLRVRMALHAGQRGRRQTTIWPALNRFAWTT